MSCTAFSVFLTILKIFGHNTKVSVKLRKSNRADEWYLVVESYPVYEKFSDKPKRIRENINRVITTPLWDKSKTTRGGAKGKEAYMPKRDINVRRL